MAGPQKLYSVPRKLDLASLFVFTTGYGLLFAVMRLFTQDAIQFLWVAGFFTSVGIAQAIFFRGKAPRLASWLTGGTYFVIVMIGYALSDGISIANLTNCGALCLFVSGGFCGYIAGVSIAGIFLIADQLRGWLKTREIEPVGEDEEQRVG